MHTLAEFGQLDQVASSVLRWPSLLLLKTPTEQTLYDLANPKGKKQFQSLAEQLMTKEAPHLASIFGGRKRPLTRRLQISLNRALALSAIELEELLF